MGTNRVRQLTVVDVRCNCWFILLLAAGVGGMRGLSAAEQSPTAIVAGQDKAPPAELIAWLTDLPEADDALLANVRQGYSSGLANHRSLAELAAQFAAASPALAATVDSAASASRGDRSALHALLETPSWLADEKLPAAVRGNIALWVAGELHAGHFYEETLSWLDAVQPADVRAPHLLHFYRAVAQHQLVRLEQSRHSAEQLLKHSKQAARRHTETAKLILRDAQGVEPDSLNHVARTMNDIRRRLGLGRGDEPEQLLQQQVLDALDKKIEDAEKQQQQQQQQAAGSTPAMPSTPMEESRPTNLKGPGDTDRRELAAGDDWGSLPPDERERVTQQISRDFPAYYREVIESYFRSLAQDPNTQPASRGESRNTPAEESRP